MDPDNLLPSLLNNEGIIVGNFENFNYRDFNQSVINSVLSYSEKNGLKFLVLTLLNKIKFDDRPVQSIIECEFSQEADKSEKFSKTIHFLSTLPKDHGLHYILVKSFDSTKHIPNDVDIFIRNEDRLKVIKHLSLNGMNCQQSSVAETKLEGRYMNIDLYTRINYLGIDFVDADLLWNSVIQKKFMDVSYPGLNPEADLLMLIPHSMFGHRRMTLLDFLHFRTLRQNANIPFCREYATRHGWGYTFDVFIQLLDTLEDDILVKKVKIRFPFNYPKKILLDSINHTKGIQFGLKNYFFFTLSYWMEGIMYSLEDSMIYNIVKSNKLLRNFFNSTCSFFKKRRGDIKSID